MKKKKDAYYCRACGPFGVTTHLGGWLETLQEGKKALTLACCLYLTSIPFIPLPTAILETALTKDILVLPLCYKLQWSRGLLC